MTARPFVLSIAGLDPSGGAGISADMKTLEALKTYGLSVCTAVTVQHDSAMNACHWVDERVVLEQLELLLSRFDIQYVKVGIIQSWKLLLTCTKLMKSLNPGVKVIWDPVLKSTTRFTFHGANDVACFEEVLREIYLLMPNKEELTALFPTLTEEQIIGQVTKYANLHLKGGHDTMRKGYDTLFTIQGEQVTFPPGIGQVMAKHGTGCVLSAALAGYLALGDDLRDALGKAKAYVEHFMASNTSLLGYHIR